MRLIERLRSYAVACAVVILAVCATASAQCVGDCDESGDVTVDEIITGVVIALGSDTIGACPAFDSNGDGVVTVEEIILAVNNALDGCPDDGCGDCDDGNPCTTDRCEDAECVYDPVVCEDDGNECTAEACDPATGCSSTNVDDGTLCDDGAGACQAGACVAFECVGDGDCDDGNECTVDTCEDNSCVSSNADDGTLCDSGAGSCQSGVCVAFECVGDGDCDDGNECTVNTCEGNSCVTANVDDGTSCDGGAGTCQSGVCAPPGEVEYQQDFESLDLPAPDNTALADDGWIVFGNVFDGETGNYKYGYGTFPAPNDGAAFCAVADGQGGAEQGDRQLSIYNDYNNTDHAAGHSIESNVFRERRITNEDVGTTLTFSFDGKRGNINDPTDELCPCTSTALAFIKTINPAAGFATTNFVKEDTTEIPDTWARYTLTLDIDAGLVNQLLQVGFSSTATLYQPSGVFYDNVLVTSSATTP